MEVAIVTKEATLQKDLACVLDDLERCSLQRLYDEREEADNLDVLA